MKIECSVEKLKNALATAERITGKNLSLPILSAVLLEVSGQSLKLRATNLSLGIELEIPGKVTKEGIVAIRGDVLNNVLTNIDPNQPVILETANDNLVVITKRNKLLVKSYPHEDFPTLPAVDGTEFTIGTGKLVEGLKSVYYSAAVSDIKQEIASVFIYGEDEQLVFVSTDSFRLAEKKVKAKKVPEFEGILMPFKNVSEIIRTLGAIDDEVKVLFNKNQISFTSGSIYLTSRLIDGVFPDYKQILPKEFKTELIVLRDDLLGALKIATVFSDKFNQITLTLKPKEKKVSLYSKNTDVGENTTELEAAVSGGEIEVNINQRYLIDCFQSITSDSISMSFNEPTRPLVVRGVSDNSFLYLIMPMNR